MIFGDFGLCPENQNNTRSFCQDSVKLSFITQFKLQHINRKIKKEKEGGWEERRNPNNVKNLVVQQL